MNFSKMFRDVLTLVVAIVLAQMLKERVIDRNL
jgi:hypothetical protein